MSRLFEFLHPNGSNDNPAPNSNSVKPGVQAAVSGIDAGGAAVATGFDLQNVRTVHLQVSETSRLIVHTDPKSPGTDRFRFLRMRLREIKNAKGLNRLLITSPLPGDGKSTIAMNLASVLSEGGARSVLLIDADLHRSSALAQLSMQARGGLAECLAGTAEISSAIVRLEPLGWYLLPAGKPPEDPTELLQGAALGDLIQEMTPVFDWVLIDSPPVLPITDALCLARQANATLVVARAGHTPVDLIKKAVGLLGAQNVIGVLLNGVAEDQHRLYKGYGSYYSEGGAKRDKRRR